MADGSVIFSAELDTSTLSGALSSLNGKGSGSLLSMFGGTGALSKLGSIIGKTIGTQMVLSFAKAVGETGIAFDTAISQVAATMGKTVGEIQPLIELAEISGRTTQYTAIEAAEALNYMALAGWDTEQIIEGFPQMLSLAAAGSMDLAYASDIVTDGITALGLEVDDTTRFVDEMAKTASKSNTSVSQLGDGILTVGGTAQILAGGTTELNTALGLLADNGIKASMGGTQLRNIILSLASPIDKAQDLMNEIGLSAYDAEGNFRPLVDIFSDLYEITSSMTEQERTNIISELFNREDMKGVNALLNTNVERWNELNGYIQDASGAAAAMAAVQLDNLGGDITLFQSAWEGLKLATFRPFEGAARSVTQFGTEVITGLTHGVEYLFNESLQATSQSAEEFQAGVEEIIRQNELAGLMYGDPTISLLYGEQIQPPEIDPPEGGFDLFEWLIPSAGAEGIAEQATEIANETVAEMDKALLAAFQNGEISYEELVASRFGEGMTDEGGAMQTIAEESVTNLSDGIQQNGENVNASVAGVLSAAKTAANTSQFSSVGAQIAGGIAKGISNGTSVVAAAVRRLVQSALEAAEAAAEIHSPSRLFASRIGEPIAAGTAVGVSNGSYLLRKAVEDMVNTSIPDMRGVASGIMASGNGGYGSSAMAGGFTQTNNFNVPVQTPDEFAKTMHLYATYGF